MIFAEGEEYSAFFAEGEKDSAIFAVGENFLELFDRMCANFRVFSKISHLTVYVNK